jgi:hypothetical protein
MRWLMAAVLTCTSAAWAAEIPANMRAMIEKTQSFGLGKFPISFWSYTNLRQHGQYMDEAEVEEWHDAGFTVPQSPTFDPTNPDEKAHMIRLLDWAHARGMKLIVGDPRCHSKMGPGGEGGLIPADYADGIRAAVADLGTHPALFGFHVGDEPDAKHKLAFFECMRVQKEIAPHLHPYANLLPYFQGIEKRAGCDTWPNYLDEFVNKGNADLISYDHYAQMNEGDKGVHSYYENLRLYREAALRNGVPFWNTVLSVGHYRYRCPNQDDIRWQFNTTIASGAHGVLWFFYYMREPHSNYRLSPVDEHWDRTQTYTDIRRVQKSFHRRYGDLFTRLASTRVTYHPEAFGGGETFTPNGIVSHVLSDREGHPVLLGEFVDLEGRRYVMLVNNSMTEVGHIGITFPGNDVTLTSWDWGGTEYQNNYAYCASGSTKTENSLTVRHFLAPGQEAVYRVESASANAEPIGE